MSSQSRAYGRQGSSYTGCSAHWGFLPKGPAGRLQPAYGGLLKDGNIEEVIIVE